MENKLILMTDSIPALIKNTHLDVTLQGWPAAITAVAFFSSCVAAYAIRVTHSHPTDIADVSSERPNAV